MIEIVPADASAATIAALARLHRQELSGGFLSSLGDAALSLLFGHAATARSAILLIARDSRDGAIVGFLLGTVGTGAFYREFFRRYAVKATTTMLPRLLSFRRIVKVMETLLYPVRKSAELPPAELLDIAIDRKSQGQGLGRRLFEAFCESLRRRGMHAFRITTGGSLTSAHAFYEKLGARRVGTIEVHRGAETVVFVYSLPSSAH